VDDCVPFVIHALAPDENLADEILVTGGDEIEKSGNSNHSPENTKNQLSAPRSQHILQEQSIGELL
jgi:hypothetical protein